MAAPIRVLVVDDDVDFRLLLTWQLGQAPGLLVVGDAADGFEALERVVEVAPDVVVIDLMMPGMDGFELIERMNADHPGIGKVAYSAMASDHVREQVARLGVELHTKSGNQQYLLDGIRAAAAGGSGAVVDVGEPLPGAGG